MKQLLKHPWTLRVLSFVLGAYMAIAGRTIRWQHVNRASAERLWAGKGPVILCLWHGRVILGHKGWTYDGSAGPIKVLSSKSREGEIISRSVGMVGVGAIRGSSAKAGKQKGALSASLAMLRFLAKGNSVALTPDGPKGPRMRAGIGAIQLARMSGAPILAYAWSCKPVKVLNTWDRLLLPVPFARGYGVWGEPFTVPRNATEAELEEARLKLEAALDAVTAEADRLAGIVGIAAEQGGVRIEEDTDSDEEAA